MLDVQNLRTQFSTDDGLVQAVNGISLSLREGETLGIVGESGCGKSVSMLSVMRLLHVPPAKISADRLYFMETDIMALSKEEMRNVRGSQIAMIFQDPMTSLNPVLTIGFQLIEPLQLHLGLADDAAAKRGSELLEMVGIPDSASRLDDYPHQFSGGMRQRAMIAMALACNPAILIADEPTTALDVTIQAQIVELIKRLQDQIGMALIWITHDLGVVAGLADRVVVMYAGYIVESASVDELYGQPRHPYTAALLRSLPRMDGSVGEDLESIKGLPPDLIQLPTGCPFAARCTFVQDKCREENPLLEEVSPQHKIACWIDVDTGEFR
ncbi:MAG: ABC transporter ATP-binding protein [Anaerolineae bacterium]|nr:ABC transporter ATP-binding protein [Anaerolineae bacterium]MBT4312567.1 ABC transporter ATP-binding protein [Anaerolineae bacterium]MBT4457690.1 ABC transporter ATP-binding protein [Anaerolineae bacterium]MBT4843465.1 ABC transporter ATP-binding protein [Anaerolineae bacterium]MBT6062376.1 ABC transporter ATP-binding protein [Anaerolineae bacterium]